MQLTIDSSEPLRKVAAVVGALYGVELVVADEKTAGRSSRSSASESGRRRSRAVAASASAKRSARRARGNGRPVDAKIVRQWAVEQGLTVSTRGQLPKSVLSAYADANAS